MKMKFAGLESLLFEDLCKVGVLANDGLSIKGLKQGLLSEPALFSGATFTKPADAAGTVSKDSELVRELSSMQVGDKNLEVNQVSRAASPVQIDDPDVDLSRVKTYM